MPIVDTQAFGETVKLGRFIIRFSFFALFALFDTEKNKKRYSTDDTVANENQFKISLMIIPEPRARAMMPRAARPSSNAKYSRRRPQRRDIALFPRLALTPKAFLKTEDKRARLERRI